MAVYTMGEVKIEGKYQVHEKLELKMNIGVNRHGYLTFGGLVSEEQAMEYPKQNADKEVVSVSLRGEVEFCGYPHEITVAYQNNHYYLRVKLITSSKLMDTKPYDRFFQEQGQTPKEILKEAYEDSGIGNLIAIRGNTEIKRPILQYRITDWLFTLLIAGKLGTVVIPDATLAEPWVSLGVPKREAIDETNNSSYLVGRNAEEFRRKNSTEFSYGNAQNVIESLLCDRYNQYGHYEGNHRNTVYDRLGYQNFLYYKMRSDNRYKLGDSVSVDGKVLTVMQKTFEYERGEIVEHYILGHEQEFAVQFHYNKMITGLELEGKVLERSGQEIKLLLDIDAGRPKSGKTWFSYSPVTNNGMYSMPLVDEKVMLQWQSEADGDALVVRPYRKNIQDMPHPEQRHFQTDCENHLQMLPGLIEFVNPVGSVKWLKSVGFDISTNEYLSINAGEDVNIKSGGKVQVFSAERLTVCKAGVESSIDMIGDDIHIKAVDDVHEDSKIDDYESVTMPERAPDIKIDIETVSKLAAAVPRASSAKK